MAGVGSDEDGSDDVGEHRCDVVDFRFERQTTGSCRQLAVVHRVSCDVINESAEFS